MADASPNRLGQANGAGDAFANFLEMFSGEVLVAFERKNKFLSRVLNKTVTSGKSWQFPATGKTVPVYHTPGQQLLGQNNLKKNKITVDVDKKLLAHEFLDSLDEAIEHYDSRGIIATEIGNALAVGMDKHILVEAVLGARASATVTGEAGGTVITDANLIHATDTTRAQAWIDSIFEAAETLDDNDAPEEGRWCALPNSDYNTLVKTVQTSGFSAVNQDYGTNGSVAKGTVYELAGIELIKTNNLTQTDQSSPAAGSLFEEHPINGTETAAVIGCQSAVGVCKLLDLSVESEYQVSRQGTLLVASYAIGMKYLRPECLIELDTTV